MAAELSEIEPAERKRITALIASAELPVAPPVMNADTLMAAMQMDKKVQGKHLRFVLLYSIGESYVTRDFSEARLNEVLRRGDGRT
jgi:3-dehydroquinate synthetase